MEFQYAPLPPPPPTRRSTLAFLSSQDLARDPRDSFGVSPAATSFSIPLASASLSTSSTSSSCPIPVRGSASGCTSASASSSGSVEEALKENLPALPAYFRSLPKETAQALGEIRVGQQLLQQKRTQLLFQLQGAMETLRNFQSVEDEERTASRTEKALADLRNSLGKLDSELPEEVSSVERKILGVRDSILQHSQLLRLAQHNHGLSASETQEQRRHFRQKFELLKNVSGITWGQHATDVIGVITYPTSACVRPFSIKPDPCNPKTQFDVVQELWQLMEDVGGGQQIPTKN